REMHEIFKKATPYSYLRGLDGKVVGSVFEKKEVKPSADDKEKLGDGKKSSSAKPTAKEGEGEPQIDYVRRLAQRMKEEERDHKSRFKAIGIVGNDVYDKLLLLKALRPQFPDAVFFTTDLDVRLLQPGDYPDTRNLLIASHYGLSLNKCLQGQVAP